MVGFTVQLQLASQTCMSGTKKCFPCLLEIAEVYSIVNFYSIGNFYRLLVESMS